jgi:hypothetical protein
MVVIIDLPYYNKTHIWTYSIFNLDWENIFSYISNITRIPLVYIKIHNNCKIYKYNNIIQYPIFKDIINHFRYCNSKTGLFTNDIHINVEI